MAIVPDAPPAWKNSRATSWPAPISAKVPYFGGSRLIVSAFWIVVSSSFWLVHAAGTLAPVAKGCNPFLRNFLARERFYWSTGGNRLAYRLP